MKYCEHPECGKSFTPKNPYARFCSDRCRRRAWKIQNKQHDKAYQDEYYDKVKLKKYKEGAKKRRLEWALTDEEAAEVMAMPCKYCGGKGGGIDRVDSSRGYTPDNVVPACKTCNYMKMRIDADTFIAQARKIVEYQSKIRLFVREQIEK